MTETQSQRVNFFYKTDFSQNLKKIELTEKIRERKGNTGPSLLQNYSLTHGITCSNIIRAYLLKISFGRSL